MLCHKGQRGESRKKVREREREINERRKKERKKGHSVFWPIILVSQQRKEFRSHNKPSLYRSNETMDQVFNCTCQGVLNHAIVGHGQNECNVFRGNCKLYLANTKCDFKITLDCDLSTLTRLFHVKIVNIQTEFGKLSRLDLHCNISGSSNGFISTFLKLKLIQTADTKSLVLYLAIRLGSYDENTRGLAYIISAQGTRPVYIRCDEPSSE